MARPCRRPFSETARRCTALRFQRVTFSRKTRPPQRQRARCCSWRVDARLESSSTASARKLMATATRSPQSTPSTCPCHQRSKRVKNQVHLQWSSFACRVAPSARGSWRSFRTARSMFTSSRPNPKATPRSNMLPSRSRRSRKRRTKMKTEGMRRAAPTNSMMQHRSRQPCTALSCRRCRPSRASPSQQSTRRIYWYSRRRPIARTQTRCPPTASCGPPPPARSSPTVSGVRTHAVRLEGSPWTTC
mmetsp:Transcript_8175/g.20542  ORF Transcript_8175/g.20542 Transcript_8175/m.20542 type:complete len:246 (-) Transcript_8175:1340-2077(-)